MKKNILFVSLAFSIALLLAFTHTDREELATRNSVIENKKKTIIRCSPDWNELSEIIEETDIPPIPGSGNHKWKISTKSDSAQFYFNQGINMYYSFHIVEAMASFKKAARFDPACGMLSWAQALAYGPNINDVGYAAVPDAIAAADLAIKNSGDCTEKEKMLIDVQRVRYSDDAGESREKLNQDYVDEMKRVYEKYPNDPDVAALYADALMLQHPWDLWNVDGTPKPWTPLIRQVLEKLLARSPNHPGANHYYIHTMEPSPYASKALPSADRLAKLTPALSHTVHMPSHIYLRLGNYTKGVAVNESAINSYRKMVPRFAPVTSADFLYVIHNLHMQTNNSMLAGRSAYSIRSAMETQNSVPKAYFADPSATSNYLQYIYMTPVLIDVRFGKWDDLLKRESPGDAYVYANILLQFGRGMAFAGLSKMEEAKKELTALKELMKDSVLLLPFPPFSSAISGAIVAESILEGTIALKDNRNDNAIDLFRIAVDTEENMVYNEPRDWFLNPKHYLGNAYVKSRQWKNAESTFKKDLVNNNENGWALFGLYQALIGQNRKAEADKVMIRFKKSFEKADIKIANAVF